MRLINAEELKHRVNNSKYYGTKRQRDFCDMIAESETIDAVEVVRCKDCKHRDLFSCPLTDNDFQKDEDFCSWGERREP